MKINIAFRALFATIGAAPRAHARIPSLIRDPRTVEEKEEVRRQTMGEHVLPSTLNEVVDGKTCNQRLIEMKGVFQGTNAKTEDVESLACSAVSKQYPDCLGCQGFTLDKKKTSVHIPGCVGMSSEQCVELAKGIVNDKPEWFEQHLNTAIREVKYDIYSVGNTYYALALAVSEDGGPVKGVNEDCIVDYPWDWCVTDASGYVKCIKIGPFDCSIALGNPGGGCLSSDACCDRIQGGGYPAPDINQNRLQCYEWVIPSKNPNPITVTGATASPRSKATQVPGQVGAVGSLLIMHLSGDKVHIPALITYDDYGVVLNQDEEIMAGQPLNPLVKPVTLSARKQITYKSDESKCVTVNTEEDYEHHVYIADCSDSNAAQQEFYYDAVTMQIQFGDRCLDYNQSTGVVSMSSDCHGNDNQKWYMTDKNELKTEYDDGKCIDYYYGLVMRECDDGVDIQKFATELPIIVKSIE